jgi:hypothetical protein
MIATSQGIKTMTLDQHKNVPQEFKTVRATLIEHREAYQNNPGYMSGIQYSFALATYKAALAKLTDQLGATIEKDLLEIISYENHMCEQYWGELVNGPMLVARRPIRNHHTPH